MSLNQTQKAALAGHIYRAGAIGFVWGQNDCCLFVADWIRARTGRDLASDFRGRYCDEAGASAVLSAAGGIERLFDERIGERVPLSQAGLGDVVTWRDRRGELLAGLLWLRGGCFLTAGGVRKVPLRDLRNAWAVH